MSEEGAPSEYSWMVDTLDVAIEEAKRKVENGRVRDVENEKVRQGWIRTLAYAMNIRRQIAKDRDLEELAETVERIKRQQKGYSDSKIETRP